MLKQTNKHTMLHGIYGYFTFCSLFQGNKSCFPVYIVILHSLHKEKKFGKIWIYHINATVNERDWEKVHQLSIVVETSTTLGNDQQ